MATAVSSEGFCQPPLGIAKKHMGASNPTPTNRGLKKT
eukprot:gene6529-2582_t